MGRSKKTHVAVTAAYMVAASLTGGGGWAEDLLDSIFWTSLAFAAFCDSCTTEVYDLCFYPAFLSGAVSLSMGKQWGTLPELAAFAAIQWAVFRKMYGGADCLAFLACAARMAAEGKGLYDYLMLMAYVFIALTLVQLARGNINRKGNLKKEVPLIPYVAATMLAVSVRR